MTKRKVDLGASLRDMADRYVEDNPADFAALRQGVRRRRARAWVVRGAGLATAAAMAGLVFYATGPARMPAETTLPPVAPAESSIATEVPLSGNLYQIAGAGDLAVVTRNQGQISRVDAGSAVPMWTVDIGGFPADVVVVSDGVWVSDRSNNRIVHMDIRTGEVLGDSIQLEADEAPTRMNVGAEAIRVVLRDRSVTRIDRATGEHTVLFDGGALDTAMGNKRFWILTDDGEVLARDPNTGAGVPEVTPVEGLGEGEITFARGAVWYGSPGSNELIRIDETDGSMIRSELPGTYVDLDGGSSGVWVLVDTGTVEGQIIEVESSDGSFVGTRFELEGTSDDLSTGGDGIWIVQRDTGRAVYLVP
ncbi:MAG: hypothetical protein ACR2KQ_00245 [Actinomycetota bacterium]